MSRKDTIIIAVLINTGLLIVLFASALRPGGVEPLAVHPASLSSAGTESTSERRRGRPPPPGRAREAAGPLPAARGAGARRARQRAQRKLRFGRRASQRRARPRVACVARDVPRRCVRRRSGTYPRDGRGWRAWGPLRSRARGGGPRVDPRAARHARPRPARARRPRIARLTLARRAAPSVVAYGWKFPERDRASILAHN